MPGMLNKSGNVVMGKMLRVLYELEGSGKLKGWINS